VSLATRLNAFAQAVGADIKSLNSKLPYKGDWSAATTYKKGDLVWYSNELWLAVTTVSGAGDSPSPDSPTAWRLVTEGMAIGGATGQILAKASNYAFDTTWVDLPSGGSSVPIDPWHVVGAAGQPAYVAPWTNSGQPIRFRKDPLGRVWIEGLATGGTSSVVFQLPVGYRPTRAETRDSLQTNGAAGTYVSIDVNGNVVLAVSNAAYVAYVDVSFDTGLVTAMPTGPVGPAGPAGPPGGNATIPMDTFHTIGAVGEPAFTNGAGNVSGYTTRFRKDPLGKVSLSGVPSLAVGSGDHIIFTLPVGYRPVGNERSFQCPCGGGGTATVWVNTDGAVHAPKGLTYAYLDAVEFDTESVTQMPTGPQGPAGPTGGNATIPMDPVHVVGAVGEPAFLGTWAVFDVTRPPRFRKDPLGKVRLSGVLKSGAIGTAAWTLPVGYRPTANTAFSQCTTSSGPGEVDITAAGAVVPVAGGTNYFFLDGVEFDTESVTQMPTGPQGPKGDTGGVDVLTTSNWNTALTTGFYRTVYDETGMSPKTTNGPGDTLNPPSQAGFVVAHLNGRVVQRVWDLDTQQVWTRHRQYDTTWTAWAAELQKPPVIPELMVGGPAPKEGDERYLQSALMKTQGVRWRQAYAATSPNTQKWEFAGGSGYRSKATAAYTCVAANTWEIVAAATFPRFTIPIAGVYRIKFGTRFHQGVNTQVEGYMGLGLTTASSPIDSIRFNAGQNTGGVDIVYLAYEMEYTFVDSQIICLMHNTQTAVANVLYSGQWMEITPLRTV
jgi:hypothetical protein